MMEAIFGFLGAVFVIAAFIVFLAQINTRPWLEFRTYTEGNWRDEEDDGIKPHDEEDKEGKEDKTV